MADIDASLRSASLTVLYFGAHFSSEAIRTMPKRAYRDLNRTLHCIGTHLDKTILLKDTHDLLREFVSDLEKVTVR